MRYVNSRSLSQQLRTTAFGKITLYHHYSKPRVGGLWPLRSIFVPVDLADEIEISISKTYSPTILYAPKANGGGIVVPAAKDDICLRAAQYLLQDVLGDYSTGVSIRIRKRIPIAAGLGGGSADAAAVITALAGFAGVDVRSLDAKQITRLSFDVLPFLRGGHQYYNGNARDPIPLGNARGFDWFAVMGPISNTPLKSTRAIMHTLEPREADIMHSRFEHCLAMYRVGDLQKFRQSTQDLRPLMTLSDRSVADALIKHLASATRIDFVMTGTGPYVVAPLVSADLSGLLQFVHEASSPLSLQIVRSLRERGYN